MSQQLGPGAPPVVSYVLCIALALPAALLFALWIGPLGLVLLPFAVLVGVLVDGSRRGRRGSA